MQFKDTPSRYFMRPHLQKITRAKHGSSSRVPAFASSKPRVQTPVPPNKKQGGFFNLRELSFVNSGSSADSR
jgi:hypothetical protein